MFLVYLFSFVLIPEVSGRWRRSWWPTFSRGGRRRSWRLGRGPSGTCRLCMASDSGELRADTLSTDWLGSMLDRLAFCQHPLWPSRWMSAGLLASAEGDWPRAGVLPDGPLGARRARLPVAAAVVARDLYRRGYSRVQGGRTTPADRRLLPLTRSSTGSSSSCRVRSAC